MHRNPQPPAVAQQHEPWSIRHSTTDRSQPPRAGGLLCMSFRPGRPVESHAPSPHGFPELRSISVSRDAAAITPVARWALIARGTAYSNRFPVPSGGGLLQTRAGSTTTLDFSRPAQRSLAVTQTSDSELLVSSLKNKTLLCLVSLSINIARFRPLDFADGKRNPSRPATACRAAPSSCVGTGLGLLIQLPVSSWWLVEMILC
jgi:hypothetical protein